MKQLLLILLIGIINISNSTKADKFARKKSGESHKQFDEVLKDLENFYYSLQLLENVDQYSMFCSKFQSEFEKSDSNFELPLLLNIMESLQCPKNADSLRRKYSYLKNNAVDITDQLGLLRLLMKSENDQTVILENGCSKVLPFLIQNSGKVKPRKNDSKVSHDMTAATIKNLNNCGLMDNEFRDKTVKMAKDALNELIEITKEQSMWVSANSLYDTMDILNEILKVDRKLIQDNKLTRIIRYITSNIGDHVSLKEKAKWNDLLDEFSKSKIRVLEIPNSFDFNSCQHACYMQIVGLPESTQITAIINSRAVPVNTQKTNLIMSDVSEFRTTASVQFQIKNDKFFVFPTKFSVKLIQENKITLTRMSSSTSSSYGDLLDSDDNNCNEITLTGNEATFLHVGFRLKSKENYSFVYLEHTKDEFEKSNYVHAPFMEEEKMNIATFDLSDFETVRPNSGVYNIFLVYGNQKQSCGKVILTFTNKEKTEKDSLTKAYQNDFTNIPSFELSDERHQVWGLYFTVIAAVCSVTYFVLFRLLKSKIDVKESNNVFVGLFYLGLVLHVATLLHYLLQYKLIDKAYVPMLQIGGLTYLFQKAFQKNN